MTSNFKKIVIVISVIFAIALSFWISVVFFVKDNSSTEINDNQQEEQVLDLDKNTKITEKQKIKTMAENFAESYYSYTWDNFSNIESQYYYMTDKMKDREKNKVEQMKKIIENQPRKYFTVRAEVIDSELVDYQESKKVILDIKLKIKEIDGAFVIDTEVPEIKPQTTALVDGNGNVYDGDMNDLIINTVDKNVEIDLVKIDDKWRVSGIKEI